MDRHHRRGRDPRCGVLGAFGPWLRPTAFGGSPYGGMMVPGIMGGYSKMGGFGWLGMLVMALFWIGVIVLVGGRLTHVFSMRQPRVELGAEEILKQRYARGEISREELVQALQRTQT